MPVIYVDATFIRSFGSKRMLTCWSSGGAASARSSAADVGLTDCFTAFLPKPHLLLDDVQVGSWKLGQLHPSECSSLTAEEVLASIGR